MTTVYDAIKAGMDANPTIKCGRGETLMDGAACAIGFIALGVCDLETWNSAPRVTRWGGEDEDRQRENIVAGLLYQVLGDKENRQNIFSWNDSYVKRFDFGHGRPPTHEEFLLELKEHYPTLAEHEPLLRTCEAIQQTSAWGS